jgi:chaperonin GroEL
VLESLQLESRDQNIGASIVKLALSYPLKQIVQNSGRDEELVIKEVLSKDDVNYGYDALLEEFTDMIEAGIIDPKKVERIALQEAVSLAGMFLTTESAIADYPSKDDLAGLPTMP